MSALLDQVIAARNRQIEEAGIERTIKLEYRVTVLEGIIEWMLTNGVFVKSIEPSEMEQIHKQAVDLLKQRYPDAKIEPRFEGRWSR